MELVKASQLGLPHISGTVNVPLAELDRMRADHALAVKLAKELEERQAEVRVTYYEEEKVLDFDSRGKSYYKTKLTEKKVEYKGFNEFRDRIADEEKAKVQKEIDRLKDNLKTLEECWCSRDGEITKLASERDTLLVTIKEKTSELNKALDEISMFKELANKDREYIEHLKSVQEELTQKLHISQNKKSFWYWLINKF